MIRRISLATAKNRLLNRLGQGQVMVKILEGKLLCCSEKVGLWIYTSSLLVCSVRNYKEYQYAALMLRIVNICESKAGYLIFGSWIASYNLLTTTTTS